VARYAARLATHATLATHFAYDGSYARARVAINGKMRRDRRMRRNPLALLRRRFEMHTDPDASEAAPAHTEFVFDPREPS
jgi:hypothetical protein